MNTRIVRLPGIGCFELIVTEEYQITGQVSFVNEETLVNIIQDQETDGKIKRGSIGIYLRREDGLFEERIRMPLTKDRNYRYLTINFCGEVSEEVQEAGRITTGSISIDSENPISHGNGMVFVIDKV